MNNSRVYAVISIFQRSLARQSRCFRLKVRGERLKAGGLRLRSKLCFMLSPEGGGCYSCYSYYSCASCTSSTRWRRGVFSANYRRNAPHDASVIGDPEHSTCGGGAGASCGDTRQICRDRTNHEELAAEPRGYTANGG